MFQNDDTSSIENNSPPTGAPKADATPAAAPAEMKLRLFNKILKFNSNLLFLCQTTHTQMKINVKSTLNIINMQIFTCLSSVLRNLSKNGNLKLRVCDLN